VGGETVNKWERSLKVAARIKPMMTGAEIGTHKGEMSAALFKTIPNLTLFMVDRWQPYSDAERVEFPKSDIVRIKDQRKWDKIKAAAVAVASLHSGATIIHADSTEASATIEDGSLDFVFIDSDHSYEGAKRENAAWIPKIKPGGYLMGYDYGDNRDAGVTLAVKELGLHIERQHKCFWAVQL
jgi:hypothetical protein